MLKVSILGCTDAAPEPSHPRMTRRRGRDAVDRVSMPRRAASCHVDSPTCADVAQIGLTRAVSAKTGETAEMASSSQNG